MGRKGVPKRKFSQDFKIHLVEKNLNEGVSLRALEIEHGLSRGLISIWRKIYLEKGPEGLKLNPKGRPKGSGRPKSQFSSELERLQHENMKLKMENLFLKKLQEFVRGNARPLK